MRAKISEKTKKDFIIHSCPERRWYVDDLLIPSMTAQGIAKDSILVWDDTKRLGNLESFVKCMKWVAKHQNPSDGIWHLQDDIVISSDFGEVTKKNDEGIVNGFCNEHFDGGNVNYIGEVPVRFTWRSFPCIRIPNSLAKEFADWYDTKIVPNNLLSDLRKDGKNDDSIWIAFITTEHPEMNCVNLLVNIVDHVDYLIGGSVVNKQRGEKRRGYRFEDTAVVAELEEKLRRCGVNGKHMAL